MMVEDFLDILHEGASREKFKMNLEVRLTRC